LQEMLLQTNLGVIRLFPAIPSSWQENGAEFQRFRGEMGVLISAKIFAGKLEYVELQAELTGVFHLENQFGAERLMLEADRICKEIICPAGSVITMALQKDEVCRIVNRR
jgi:alpha-L-fucosidase 2